MRCKVGNKPKTGARVSRSAVTYEQRIKKRASARQTEADIAQERLQGRTMVPEFGDIFEVTSDDLGITIDLYGSLCKIFASIQSH